MAGRLPGGDGGLRGPALGEVGLEPIGLEEDLVAGHFDAMVD